MKFQAILIISLILLTACSTQTEISLEEPQDFTCDSTNTLSPLKEPILGATYPSLAGREIKGYFTESIDFMGDLNMNSIRFRAWEGWTLEELEKFLCEAEKQEIYVSLVLSHAEHSFISGYPNNLETSLEELRALLPILDKYSSVWGFDIRAEPFAPRHSLDEQEEITWLEAISSELKVHNPDYQVYTNLMQSSTERIPEVSPFSDYIAINYYFPYGKELKREYKEKEVSSEVYEQEMEDDLDELLEEVKELNIENKPIIIAQFGAIRGKVEGKTYTTEEGQSTWYRVFFSSMKKHEEIVGGYYLFVLAGGEKGYYILDENAECVLACDEIKKAHSERIN